MMLCKNDGWQEKRATSSWIGLIWNIMFIGQNYIGQIAILYLICSALKMDVFM